MDNINNFSKELRVLYSKTGIKAIEDNYISILAEVREPISDSDIINWIRSANAQGLQYSDPKVYEALLALTNVNESDLKSKFNYWLVQNCVNTPPKEKGQVSQNYAKLLSYFMVFGELLGSDDTNLILRPFSGIIQFFNQPDIKSQCKLNEVSPDRFTVFKNVSMAQNLMVQQSQMESSGGIEAKPETGMETKQEKKQNLYDDIYDWFSDDIKRASLSKGYNNFAEKMEEGGLLGNTAAMQQYLDSVGLGGDIVVDDLNILYADLVDDLVNYITKPAYLNKYLRMDKHRDLYREIKEYIMQTLQYVSASQLTAVRKQRALQKRIPSRTKKDSFYEGQEPVAEIDVPEDAFLDGIFLSMVSKVLLDLHNSLNL